MKRALFIHGWGNSGTDYWFPNEKNILEKVGYKVESPDFPNTDNPELEKWLSVIEAFSPEETDILLGLSLGGPSILSYLQRADKKVDKAFLIASPIWKLGYPETDDFFEEYDWEKIKRMANNFIVINQKNDPYVDLEHGVVLAKNLDINLTLVDGDDHFHEMDLDLINKHLT